MIFSGRSSYAWLVRETFITSNGFFSKSRSNAVHCPKRNPNFRDKTWNVEENEILHEIFRWVSQLPRYISCNIAKNVLPVGQCILDRLRNMNRFDGFVWWGGGGPIKNAATRQWMLYINNSGNGELRPFSSWWSSTFPTMEHERQSICTG